MLHFTNSMKSLYETSVLCEHALSPSPITYANAITAYVEEYYYGEGVKDAYWVFSKVTRRANSGRYCNTRLQQDIIRYENASMAFAAVYDDYPQPPKLHMVNRTPVQMLPKQDAPQPQERFRKRADVVSKFGS